MAETVSIGELKARRLPILDKREANRAKEKPSQKIEDECNKQLRALNCAIQGIPNPDEALS